MSHRAGLVREPPVGHYFDPAPPALIDVVKSLAGTTLVFEPGTRTKYSNAGIAVVGAVVERVERRAISEGDRACAAEVRWACRGRRSSPTLTLTRQMAHGLMWTYDGQAVATPTFLLGTGPAGNLVSTVVDLGRFRQLSVCPGTRTDRSRVIKPETLRSMIEPQPGKPGESPGFGLGFAISKLDGERRIGHGGAVYGFATEVEALPDAKLGVVVITTADCANGVASQIAETALRMMLAVRDGRPLRDSGHVAGDLATTSTSTGGALRQRRQVVDIVERGGKLFLESVRGGMTVEIREQGDSLVVDDRLVSRSPARARGAIESRSAGKRYEKKTAAKPAASRRPLGWA